ncbi:MAG: ABC transporter ATP-binding protein [Bacteriovoracaceae bacterium]|nr:ABC transporter ATP-binding protein [Bacteriovoracaceae bacterium]
MKPIVSAKKLSVGHQGLSILSDLSFDIFPGDFICLMGSNGRGKTTLLRTLSSLLTPIAGEIFIAEREISQFSAIELAKTVSVVLTERIDIPNISVWDFVSMGRAPYTNFWGALGASDNAIVEESLIALGFFKQRNRLFNELSDGQKQKVLIARALAQNTPVILLDEPTNFLDMPRKMELMVLLKRIAAEKNKAILFSSHDWELALEMNTHLWLIDDSGEFNVGMPEEIILQQKLFSSFKSSEIVFSTKKGRFEEVISPVYSVALEGDEYGVKWTGHALRKKRISVDTNSAITIVCHQSYWEIVKGDRRVRLDDLFSVVWFNYDSF